MIQEKNYDVISNCFFLHFSSKNERNKVVGKINISAKLGPSENAATKRLHYLVWSTTKKRHCGIKHSVKEKRLVCF